MKRKKQIEEELLSMLETEHDLNQYDLGWRAGYRKALKWVLSK